MTIQRYAKIDQSGKNNGFYSDDVWPVESMPEGVTQISEELYQAWLADTSQLLVNGALTAAPLPTPTEADYSNAIQAYIDQVAQSKQYTDGNSCATYALLTESPPGTLWKEEATVFIAWRANVWAYAFQQFALVQGGQRAQPTVEQILTEIQGAVAITWPSPT